MKRFILGTVLLASLTAVPPAATAQVSVSVNIALPPPVAFAAPPEVIVLPDTDDVYVIPDTDVDIFFWDGWWWRLWDGRWYRSHYYDRGWAHYRSVPRFYYDVDPSWRTYYRNHHWRGYRWDYERIPDRRLEQNWSSWRSNGYWRQRRHFGVEAYRPLPAKQRQDFRNWRQEQYRQRPDVQWHEQQRPQERRQPQVQPRQQPQQRVHQPQRQEQQPRLRKPQGHPQPQQHGQGSGERVRGPQRQEQRPHAQQQQHSRAEGRPERGPGEGRR